MLEAKTTLDQIIGNKKGTKLYKQQMPSYKYLKTKRGTSGNNRGLKPKFRKTKLLGTK